MNGHYFVNCVARQAPLSMGFSRKEDEWVAISFRGSSRPRDRACVSRVSCMSRWILYQLSPTGKLKHYVNVRKCPVNSSSCELTSQTCVEHLLQAREMTQAMVWDEQRQTGAARPRGPPAPPLLEGLGRGGWYRSGKLRPRLGS